MNLHLKTLPFDYPTATPDFSSTGMQTGIPWASQFSRINVLSKEPKTGPIQHSRGAGWEAGMGLFTFLYHSSFFLLLIFLEMLFTY